MSGGRGQSGSQGDARLMLEEDKGGGHGGCPKQRHRPGQRPGGESMTGELGSCRRLVWLEQSEEGRAEK